MSLQPGQTIRQYRIDRKIGEGGMGVVYLAEDTRLGRRIALKVLPAGMSADPGRRARFEREARAVAALNHPNIVTLHSVEDVDGTSFITMELVDGQRLTELLPRDGLALPKLIGWSLAIADALGAAHRQGVVHRDLKPDNIMLTADGRLKVLDFGLAKLGEPSVDVAGTVLPTTPITTEGNIVGTVSYMSPEQAEGKPLDYRSDIFSFGVVLDEMATGRRPFQGDTAISTISSILKDTPPAIQKVNASLPPQLGRIVRRCLSKEPERRYQSTDDLRNELRELKEDSESGELALERPASATPAQAGSARRLARPALAALAGVLVTVMAAAGWYWLGSPGSTARQSAAPSQVPTSLQLSRATTDGRVREAAISPDGRYLAYVRREGALTSLRLRQVVTGDEVQVVASSEAGLTTPSFSADGNFLHYVSLDPGRFSGWVYRVSVLGGTPRRIVDGAGGVAASPDGKWLALLGGAVDSSYVRIVGVDGDAPRDLATRKGRDHFDSVPRWSPDGRSLAIISHRYGEPQQLVLIDAAAGTERPLSLPSMRSFRDLSWLPGKDSLIVTGSERPVVAEGPTQIWEVATNGSLQPLTRDLNVYSDVTVTADGLTIAAVRLERRSGIDVAAVRDGMPGAFTELIPVSAARAGLGGLAWLGNERLAHGMMQADMEQIFVTDLATKTSRALTAGVSHHEPAVSRDGRAMVAMRAEGDHSSLWRIDPETGRSERLTEGPFDVAPVINSNGSTILYFSIGESLRLLRTSGTGGEPVELTTSPSLCWEISPDDQDALCFVSNATGEPQSRLIPVAGGEPRVLTGIPPAAKAVAFSPEGLAITYLTSRDGADELWSLPLRGGQPRRLVRFEGKEIFGFKWSNDGKQLAVVRGSESGDVVLLKRAK